MNSHSTRLHARCAFSLGELLFVIAVIGVIAAFAMGVRDGAMNKKDPPLPDLPTLAESGTSHKILKVGKENQGKCWYLIKIDGRYLSAIGQPGHKKDEEVKTLYSTGGSFDSESTSTASFLVIVED